MLNSLKHHLGSIDGVTWYPIFSLLLFVVFFIGLGVYTALMKRKDLDHLKGLPLEEDEYLDHTSC